VIGLVQIGGQWRADRYTYFAFVGLFLAAAWQAAALAARFPRARAPTAVLAVALLVAWALVSERQLSYWRGTRPLFEHALAVDPDNVMAHASLAAFAETEGRVAEALAHLEQALRIPSRFDSLRYDRGRLLLEVGRTEEARGELQRAMEERPRHAATRFALALAHERLGERAEAVREYREGLELDPGDLEARRRLDALRRGVP
jgi:tetratricopeptide (TPR) repeat protein